MPVLALATTVLELLPSLITAGVDVLSLIQNTSSVIKTAQSEGRDPTDDEWSTLDTQISALRAQLSS